MTSTKTSNTPRINPNIAPRPRSAGDNPVLLIMAAMAMFTSPTANNVAAKIAA
jgi:hypothetical protein